MKKMFQCLAGLNAATIVRGTRLGIREFWQACFASYAAVWPFETLKDSQHRKTKETLNSIPVVSMDEIIGSEKAVLTLDLVKYEDGILPFKDRVALISILAMEKPTEVLEIGTYMGYTTKAMANNLKNAAIHTVDLPPNYSTTNEQNLDIPKDDFHLILKREVGREFKGQIFPSRIIQHFGDTAVIDFNQFGHPTFYFIDGSHTYEYCKQDSEKCFNLCGGKGVFVWHDCDEWHPDILKFIIEWRQMGRKIVRVEGTNLAYWKNA